MKNLIRSKEEQIRKQEEAEIARKPHEIQSSPSRKDLYILKATACTKRPLRGRPYAVADLGEGPGGPGPPRPYLG